MVTAEVLLDEICWIDRLHPNNSNRPDMFMVKAWCSDPTLLPDDEFMASVGADTVVEVQEDPAVGRSFGIDRPRVEVPSDLPCGP